MSTEKRDKALERAIEKAGGVAALCRFINERVEEEHQLTTQAISQWQRCPDRRVLLVEQATSVENGLPQVTRSELRPDLYPAEPVRKKAA